MMPKSMQKSNKKIDRKLSTEIAKASTTEQQPKVSFDEPSFRWVLNEDPMAVEKLAEGIRKFTADAIKIKKHLSDKLSQ
ncbi:Transaldolase [Gamsiella multidivaricata]|nr:Transaldolase [Gamsiella multidivaricata]